MTRVTHGLLIIYVAALTTSIAVHSLATALLILVALYLLITKKIKWIGVGPDKALWLFWGLIALGAVMIAELPAELRWTVVSEARWVVVLYLIAILFTAMQAQQKEYVRILFMVATLVGVYACVQAFTGLNLFRSKPYFPSEMGGIHMWRAKGFFANPMDFTYSIGSVLCLAVAGWISQFYKGRERWHVLATMTVLAGALLFTFTRGAWLGALLAVTVMVVMYGRQFAKKYFLILFLALGIGFTVSPALRQRVYSIYDEGGNKSISQRYDLWRANWAMFKDHPLLGVGYGQNAVFTQQYHLKLMGHEGFVANAHNNFLQVLAGAGIFAFLLWIYFCGYFIWLAYKTWRPARNTGTWPEFLGLGAIGVQVFFHFGGLTQATFFDNEPLHILLFVWSLLAAHRAQQRTSHGHA